MSEEIKRMIEDKIEDIYERAVQLTVDYLEGKEVDYVAWARYRDYSIAAIRFLKELAEPIDDDWERF